MELIGIEALKRLPHHSSSSIQEIEKQLNVLVELAATKATAIRKVADLLEPVSSKRVEMAHDEISVIRQIDAALKEFGSHFSQTMADGSVEVAQHRVAESLRKAKKDVELIAGFVAR